MHVFKGNKGHQKYARMLFLKAAVHSKPDIPLLHLSNTSKKRGILYSNFMLKTIIIAGGKLLAYVTDRT